MNNINTKVSIKPSLTEVCALYCDERPLRPSTVRMYTYVTGLFERDTGISALEDITAERLLEWRDDVVARSTTTTFNNYHRHLRSLLNFCVELGLIESNPMSRIKPFTRANTRRKACSRKDILKLCNHLKSDTQNSASPVILAIVLTLYYTGIRCSQLCGLIWRDIDFEQNTIRLRKYHSKNGREWHIPLHNSLRPWLEDLRIDAVDRFADFSESDQVFRIQAYSSRYMGDRLTPMQLTDIFRRFSLRCGVKVTPHKIRHLFATSLANQHREDYEKTGDVPVTLVSIKEILGHSNIATTVSYIEPRLSGQRVVIKGLEDLDDF